MPLSTPPDSDALALLRQDPLFADLSGSQLARLLASLHWVEFAAGEMLSAQLASLPDAGNYTILPERLSVETIAIGYRKGDAAMGELVNASIKESMRSGAAKGWYEQWFLKPAKAGGKPLFAAMPAEMKTVFDAAKAN